ncbi:MAG: hypothetical protein C4K60_08075 [Ideonella sp. MAG2]|nr:MAG: hypothetical protein C4K60_08075 [Ideonella sp. MAG2]
MLPASPLYTIATLDIPAEQARWIQNFRQAHDPHFKVVEPHFTLVFGIRDLAASVVLAHVAKVVAITQPIRFRCAYAMLGADDIDDTAYVFLVPNEGNAEVSLLHDALYTGELAPFLRLEFPYIPHITMAASQDFRQAKRLCDQLNQEGVEVSGLLNALTVGVLRDGRFEALRRFELGAALQAGTGPLP